ncbi:short-chain dehydrogenase [Lentithecium fluviatile CBS 122367]|uniref:Short-chain dehydrogenase n=1 Tax=Lentithecium fluviatile CBS 122367 TaxID=1168545 RepID=A0A6G1IES8_9PLEO|nr:short-chain dehydrogenase [Lentithecium fluviatile CBS 122367]
MTTRYTEVHKNPQGPGDARPTALQIVRDEGLQNGLTDKSIFITGASSGLGLETAKTLFTTGATLYLTARNLEKAKQGLGSELVNSTRVHLLEMDQNSLASVRACAKNFLSLTDKLNVFIANAGVMATPEGHTADGFETQFGVNHLSHFLLFVLLRPALLAAASPHANSRAVFLSSIAHRGGEVDFEQYNLDGAYDKWKAYSQSKTASLWTANEADRRYGGYGLRVFSVQPGGIQTGLLQHMSQEEKQGLSVDPALGPQFKSPEQGAATTVWGAISKSLEGMGGKYLEDVQIARPWQPSDGQWAPGYAPHAFSPEKEAKLWELSLKLAGEES